MPKDISVLWALGSLETQVAIEDAVNAAAVAVIAQFDELAPIRARGAVRSGSGLAIAVIPEHTSRVGDPNLHVHAVISSKVQDPETGRWYALDARELKLHQQMMAAQFHRGLEAELSVRLQVSWGVRTQAYAAPLTGSNQDLCEALSKRTRAVNRRLEAKLERFDLAFGRGRRSRCGVSSARQRLSRDLRRHRLTRLMHAGFGIETATYLSRFDLKSSIDPVNSIDLVEPAGMTTFLQRHSKG